MKKNRKTKTIWIHEPGLYTGSVESTVLSALNEDNKIHEENAFR